MSDHISNRHRPAENSGVDAAVIGRDVVVFDFASNLSIANSNIWLEL